MPSHSPGRSIESLLSRFSEVARPEILKDHLPNSCVASTWITIEVVRQFGFSATPLEVRLTVGNAEYRRLRDQHGRPPRTNEELVDWGNRHGAWTIGVGWDQESGGIGGHVVALLEGRYLVDASIEQVTDASHEIVPPPVLWGLLDPLFLYGQKPLQRMDTGGLFVEYILHPTAVRYEQLPDWGHNPETDGAVERIVAACVAET